MIDKAEIPAPINDLTCPRDIFFNNFNNCVSDSANLVLSDSTLAELEGIHKSLDSISGALLTINSFSLSDMLLPLVGAVVGAFAAYVFNIFHWRYTRELDNRSAVVNSLREQVAALEIEAISYWIDKTDASNLKEMKLCSIKIKTCFPTMVRHLALIEDKVSGSAHEKVVSSVKDMLSELYDLVTSGDFESHGRESDDAKASKAARLCGKIQGQLSLLAFKTR
tara:strand:- start:5702 stop:6370 length:669 start_codon:yes stop_codon:yes gene_type:complete